MLDLPPLSPRLRRRAQAETMSVLRRLDRMRINEVEPFLLSSWPPAKVGIQIDLVLNHGVALRSLRINIADPKSVRGFSDVALPVFGDRESSATALESRVYVDYATLVLAHRHPDGRPYYATPDTMLKEIIGPEGGPLNVADRIASCPDPDASLRNLLSIVHAWQELEHRTGESNHQRIERLRAQSRG